MISSINVISTSTIRSNYLSNLEHSIFPFQVNQYIFAYNLHTSEILIPYISSLTYGQGATMYDNDRFTLSHNFIVYFCIFNSIYHKKPPYLVAILFHSVRIHVLILYPFSTFSQMLIFRLKIKISPKKIHIILYAILHLHLQITKKLYNSKDD